MNMDLSPITGSAALLAGIAMLACLPRAAARLAWAVAILVILATAGRHFYTHPPFNDGAYFELRPGGWDGLWPAGPVPTMLGLAVIGIAAEAVLWPPPTARRGWQIVGHWLLTLVAVGVCCYLYEWFAELVDAGSQWRIWVLLAVCAAVAAAGRKPVPRSVLCQATVLLLVCSATWLLYVLPL